jgi:hypothetical protein
MPGYTPPRSLMVDMRGKRYDILAYDPAGAKEVLALRGHRNPKGTRLADINSLLKGRRGGTTPVGPAMEWKANLIRWALITTGPPNSQPLDLPAYDRWLEKEIQDLDAVLPLCEKYGLMVLIDVHSPPGGRFTASGYAGSDAGLFTDPRFQTKFVEIWERMARRIGHIQAQLPVQRRQF